MSEQEQTPEFQDQGTGYQEYVVEWTREGKLERVVCRGTSAEDRAREWHAAMKAEEGAAGPVKYGRPEDPSIQYPAAVHVEPVAVFLRLGGDVKRQGSRAEDWTTTFFDGARAAERANEFAARAKERAY